MHVMDATQIAGALDALRAKRPLVQNITNFVSMDIAANALLAIGASPAMVHAPEEVEQFVSFAGALCINIGTLSSHWVEGMRQAAASANKRGLPWVLDPVGVGATTFRNQTVQDLLQHRPSIIRGNASEIMAIAGLLGISESIARPHGVDSANSTDEAVSYAQGLARHLACVIVATGAVDIVTDGDTVVRIANGSPIMAKVTAVGCALSAITAAFCASTFPPLLAACAAVSCVGIAGNMADERASLPGSFRVAWIDALAAIDAAEIGTRLRLI